MTVTRTVTYRGIDVTVTIDEYAALVRAAYDDPAEALRLADVALERQRRCAAGEHTFLAPVTSGSPCVCGLFEVRA